MSSEKSFLFICFLGIQIYGQTSKDLGKRLFFAVPEVLIGKTMEANTDFPETKLQRSFFLSIGNCKNGVDDQLGKGLKDLKTGITLGITDFGNIQKVGIAYSVMPFVEIGLFRKYSTRWNLSTGLGGAYMDTQFDADKNSFNRAVSTKINWSFKSFLYYNVLNGEKLKWRLGLGYVHFSNGHTRLPNQGLNSFLVSLSSVIGGGVEAEKIIDQNQKKKILSETYLSFRTGIGQNVLSRTFNDKKEVYSVALSGGKIINNTFKFGGGFYYRFYEHYYDHIVNDRRLISDQVPHFQESPYKYATNFGVFINGELIMGHFGIGANVGVNIYKPFYKIDWQLSQGDFFNNQYTKLGELNSYYKVKRTISSRLGMRYYLFNVSKSPINNVFIGAALNANLGQADFSEFSLGYMYKFRKKSKK